MKSTEDLRLGKQYLKIRSYDKALEHLTKAVIQGDRAAGSLLYKLGDHIYYLMKKSIKRRSRLSNCWPAAAMQKAVFIWERSVNTGIRDGRISRRLLAIMQKLTGWGFRAVLTRQAN